MANNFTPKPFDLEDNLAKWWKSKNGKRYTSVREANFIDPKFKDKVVDACNKNFSGEGESQKGFNYDGQTFSLSLFNGNVMLWEGASIKTDAPDVKLPENFFKKAFGGGGKNYLQVVQGAAQAPAEFLPFETAVEKATPESGLAIFHTSTRFNEETGVTEYLVAKPVKV